MHQQDAHEGGFDLEALHDLLPEVFRTRDADLAEGPGGGPLMALLAVVAEQVAGVEEGIDQLYDDQFIETCAEWAVPYLADLIGYRPFDPLLQDTLGSTRAEVADTIRFRRRKGTAAVLQELAVSVTDWDAAVVEFFQRLAVTQHLNHLRVLGPDRPGTVEVRHAGRLEPSGTPFDVASHTADVRLVAGRRGRTGSRGYWNIPNVGIFLWRTGGRRLTDAPAFRVDARRFLFDALGANTHLVCAARRDATPGRLTLPVPITRRLLRAHLADLYGPGNSLSVHVGDDLVPLDQVHACDLSDTGPDPDDSPWHTPGGGSVAIDPVLGRIWFPADVAGEVRVTYHHAARAEIGGGEYDRQQRLRPSRAPELAVPGDRPTLGQALADLAGAGTVTLTGSDGHPGPGALLVGADALLEVRAANGSRPLLRLGADLVIGGGDGGEVVLDGLVIAGGRLVVPDLVDGQPNRLQRLRLVDCTLVPGLGRTRSGQPAAVAPSLVVEAPHVSVEIDHCVVGAVRVVAESSLAVTDSILDGLAPHQVAYAAPGDDGTAGDAPGGELTVTASTLVGKVHTARLTASNSILHARLGEGDTWAVPVRASRRQAGYVRYSYVPWGSRVPPRYACVPATGSEAAAAVPRFASLRHHSAGYAQLHPSCPGTIRTGADDRGEMGAFHGQYAPQREAGLWTRLDEYLRFGLEAGVMFAT